MANLEQCVDEVDQSLATLTRYPMAVLATAIRIHLSAMLHTLHQQGMCSPADIRAFATELEREALQAQQN